MPPLCRHGRSFTMQTSPLSTRATGRKKVATMPWNTYAVVLLAIVITPSMGQQRCGLSPFGGFARCGFNQVCRNGFCACWNPAARLCGGLCRNILNDPLACGGCGKVCWSLESFGYELALFRVMSSLFSNYTLCLR
jgi:hypothetical protein